MNILTNILHWIVTAVCGMAALVLFANGNWIFGIFIALVSLATSPPVVKEVAAQEGKEADGRMKSGAAVVAFFISTVCLVIALPEPPQPEEEATVAEAPPVKAEAPLVTEEDTPPDDAGLIRRSEEGEWYVGGTLHDATWEEWTRGTYGNKLATTGDWLLAYMGQDQMAQIFHDGARQLSVQIVSCVDESTHDLDLGPNQKASAAAVLCMMLMQVPADPSHTR